MVSVNRACCCCVLIILLLFVWGLCALFLLVSLRVCLCLSLVDVRVCCSSILVLVVMDGSSVVVVGVGVSCGIVPVHSSCSDCAWYGHFCVYWCVHGPRLFPSLFVSVLSYLWFSCAPHGRGGSERREPEKSHLAWPSLSFFFPFFHSLGSG